MDDISLIITQDDGEGPYQAIQAWNGVNWTPLASTSFVRFHGPIRQFAWSYKAMCLAGSFCPDKLPRASEATSTDPPLVSALCSVADKTEQFNYIRYEPSFLSCLHIELLLIMLLLNYTNYFHLIWLAWN